MPRQGNLFGGVGTPIGDSIFDPIYRGSPNTGAMRPAQRSAMTFMENGPQRQFALPNNGPGPQRQQSFDFAGSTRRPSRLSAAGGRFRKGFKEALIGGVKGGRRFSGALGPVAIVAEGVFAAAIVTAGAIQGSAQWGAPTGLEEDYVGGAVYGATKGVGTATGGAIGGITGFALGSGIGSVIFPGPGTIIGGIIGGIAGAISGEGVGGTLLQGPARQLGLGARAIVKTARAVDRIQFGGNFVDSRAAHTMRQRAVSDMSGSMMNARQFLGNEAIFLHER